MHTQLSEVHRKMAQCLRSHSRASLYRKEMLMHCHPGASTEQCTYLETKDFKIYKKTHDSKYNCPSLNHALNQVTIEKEVLIERERSEIVI